MKKKFLFKDFLVMNMFFTFMTGIMVGLILKSDVIDYKFIGIMSMALISLSGLFISVKGMSLSFSRDYKKVNNEELLVDSFKEQ